MNTTPNTNRENDTEHLKLIMDAVRKIYLAKCLNENDWKSIRKNLGQSPVIIKVPKMVDGQGTPDISLARAEQPIMASSISDDFTIQQVLRHYGITPSSVTLWETAVPLHQYIGEGVSADENIHNLMLSIVERQLSIRKAAETFIMEIGYKGELRWGEYPL